MCPANIGAKATPGNVAENHAMLDLRQMEEAILANGKVESQELEMLRRELYSAGKIGRREADFLVVLHKRLQHLNPSFQQFFYQAIKDHVLANGRISTEEATWLRRMLFTDGKFKDEERKLLRELKGEAKEVSHEFEVLFAESMKLPPEPHTSGSGRSDH